LLFKRSVAILLVMQFTLVAARAQVPAPAQAPVTPVPTQTPGAPAPTQTPGAPAPTQTPGAPAPAQTPGAPLPAQTPGAPVPTQTPVAPLPTIQNLKVLVLEGQRSVNNTTRHIGIQPVVEVRDQNDRPIEGASVIFRLPPSGPGGTFAGKSPTLSAGTNARGQAAASGFVPNDELGKFDIHVTATYQNQTGETTISQTNSPNALVLVPSTSKQSIWRRHKYLLIGGGVALGAGIALIVILTSGKTNVTITPGAVTINQ
jgi:hypothetical protein